MPSIDSSPSLRIEYRRANVVAFWMLVTATLFAASSLVAIASGVQAPWRVSVVVVSAAVLPGLVWRPWFENGIWVWNGCTYFLAAALAAYVLRVSYLLIVVPLGTTSSSLDLSSGRGRSRWIMRPDGMGDRTSAGLNAFVRTPGNAWTVVALFPLLLLSWLRHTSRETAPPGSTYTLY